MRAPEETTPPSLDAAADPVTRTVAGGSGSVSAQLNDLLTAHRFLASAVTTLDDCARQVHAIDLSLGPQDAVLSPATASRCTDSAAGLNRTLLAASARAQTYAGQMAVTVMAYELAEMTSANRFGSIIMETLGPITMHGATQGWRGVVDPESLSGILPLVIAGIDIVAPGSYEKTMLELNATYGEIDGPDRPGHTSLVAGPGSSSAPIAARSIGESMKQVEEMYADNSEVSHIQVQRVVDPATGQGRWVVMLPGTSEWGPHHNSVLNGRDNLIAQAGGVCASETAVKTAIEDAMRREGVLDRHEPVMLVGHSQGGISMTNLARHNKTLNITNVVTYGSPVGRMALPKNVRALNIENTRDIVPKLDGLATGDGDPRRTRLAIDDPHSFDDGHGGRNIIAAHDPGRYRRDYETVAARERSVPGSAVTGFETATAGFFTGTARTYQYDARRDPVPQRTHEDPPNPALRPKAWVNPSTGSYVVNSP